MEFQYLDGQKITHLILAFAIYLSLAGFLLIGLLRVRNRSKGYQPKISIVIAARNEAANIERCLQALSKQTYPKHLTQIVAVDDRSEDNTYERMERFRANHRNNMIIQKIKQAPENVSPKKAALARGINLADGEILFTTDADCAPPPDWIAETVPLFSEHVGIVIGAAPFEPTHTPWQKLMALDNFAAAFVAAGAAGWNLAATGTGRNLAYRKAAYEEVGGFDLIQHSLSGDDDLFLQLVKKRTRWRIGYSLNPKTAVPSPPAKNLADFIQQRRRHVSAAKYYSKPLQAAYLLFNLSNLILFALLVRSIWIGHFLSLAIMLFCSKLALDFTALFLMTHKFNRLHLLRLFPIWEIFFLVNQTVISPSGLIGRIKWK